MRIAVAAGLRSAARAALTLLLLALLCTGATAAVAPSIADVARWLRSGEEMSAPRSTRIDGRAAPLAIPSRKRRNVLIFSKIHRSMWPYSYEDAHYQELPKRHVLMDGDAPPYFD